MGILQSTYHVCLNDQIQDVCKWYKSQEAGKEELSTAKHAEVFGETSVLTRLADTLRQVQAAEGESATR